MTLARALALSAQIALVACVLALLCIPLTPLLLAIGGVTFAGWR